MCGVLTVMVASDDMDDTDGSPLGRDGARVLHNVLVDDDGAGESTAALIVGEDRAMLREDTDDVSRRSCSMLAPTEVHWLRKC